MGIYYENNLIFYPKPYNKTIESCNQFIIPVGIL
jgi:hypothetical protein